MSTARRILDVAACRPKEAVQDVLGLAALCAMIVAGVSATGFL